MVSLDAEAIARAEQDTTERAPRTGEFSGSVRSLLFQLQQPVDHASSTFFRVSFGAIMAWWAWDYLVSGRVKFMYVDTPFHFTYAHFDFVQPWPGPGMYLHFLAMVILGLAVAAGFFYRISSSLLAVLFVHFFLMERTNYQNHYYLIALISCWLPFLPLHHGLSVDMVRKPSIARETVPRWTLLLLQFHIAVPYFYGGLAKLTPDWLLGEPMRQMLAAQSGIPIVGPLFLSELTVVFFTIGGIVFDLGIVPALLYRRTRLFAYIACIGFHITNSVLFNIHIFPWFMIAATLLFFEPSWPRYLLSPLSYDKLKANKSREEGKLDWRSVSLGNKLLYLSLLLYATFHLVWPLRHNLYEGETSWTEQGHYFSWRMMLRGKIAGVRYYLTDPTNNATSIVDLRPYINTEQAGKFTRDPEMILDLAHHIAKDYQSKKGTLPEVRALVLSSLNGRKPQLFIDPSVDLVQVSRTSGARSWILPQKEPLRKEPWNIPLVEWEKHVEIPLFLPPAPQQTSTTSPPEIKS